MNEALRRAHLSLYALALLAACGGNPETETPAERETTAGGEAPAAEVPAGPPATFLSPDTKVVVRLDISRMRRSPLAEDVAAAIRSTQLWQEMASRGGIDAIEDFDLVLIGANAIYTDRRILVIRTTRSEAEIRERVLAMSVQETPAPDWRDIDGYPAISWPMAQSDVPHSIVLTASHEIVLAPDDELPRIAQVARDHASRRPEPEAIIEPHLAMRESEYATLLLDVPLPRRPEYPQSPTTTHIEVDELADGAEFRIDASFADEEQAIAGETWVNNLIHRFASSPVVQLMGMSRPLETAIVTRTTTRLSITANLTTEELRRALGMVALAQIAM